MTDLILIACGGALGAVLRYLLTLWTAEKTGNSRVFTGTVAANCAGCLLAGLVIGWFSVSGHPDSATALFLTVGLLGSFTTFSTFSLELSRLLNEPSELIKYLFWQAGFAIFLAATGIFLGSLIGGVYA